MIQRLALLSFLLAAAVPAEPICSFETPEQCALVVAAGAKTSVVEEHATDGRKALRAVFPGSQKDSWPGLSFRPPAAALLGKDMLCFDVHNPAGKEIHLSWRIDGAGGQKIFGGAKVKPKGDTLSIYLQALGEQIPLDAIRQFYLYQRMPREDVTLFFDNFRTESFSDSFVPMTYRQTEPAVPPAAADRERGYQLFARHWLDFVFPQSRPRAGETMVRLDAFATPGEAEPLTFSVLALRELKGARVTVGDLLSAEGARLPAAAVAVYPVRCLDKRVVYSSKQFIRDVPVLLERRQTVDLAPDTARRFWLDIRVPADTAPGVYQGTATFAAEGAPSFVLPMRVRVLPFVLPEPKNMFFGEYYQGPKLATTPEQKRAFLERDLRDMRAQGMTSLGLCFGVDTKPATFADGKAKLVFDGSSLFEHCMNLYRDLGFPAPIVLLSDSGQGFASKSEAPFGSPEYKAHYQAFWRAMQAECKARNWPELIVQPVDEPGWQDQEAKDRNTTLLKWLKEIPGMRTEQDGPGDGYFHGVAGPHADMWNYNGGIGKDETVAAAKAKGHLIALYNCDVESYRPETQRYVAGFFQQRAGTHGCYNWAYMSFSGSPYSDFDFRTGTWMHVYPEWKEEAGGPSIGWMGFREGIDDYRYALALEQAAERAEREGDAAAKVAAKAGRQQLASLLATLDYSPQIRSRANFASRRPVEGGFEVGGPYKLPNGWDFQTYDIARWQLAEATRKILGTEAERALPPTAVPGELLVGATWAEAPAAGPASARVARQVAIPQVEGEIAVDGEFGEDAWRRAATIGDFELPTGGKPQAQTRAWLLRTATAICVAVECDEPYTSMMTTNVAEDGGAIWKDDCVELFFDPNLDRTTFRQLAINSIGKVLAVDSTGAKWQPKIQVATQVLEDKWRVELVLPLADLQATSTSFGFNLCRERRPTEIFELSCWSPTGGGFGEPARFGVATLGASFLRRVTLGEGVLGPNELTAAAGNPTGVELHVRLVAVCAAAEGGEVRSAGEVATLPPGQGKELAATYTLATAEKGVTVRAVLEDARTGKILAEQQLSQDVASPLRVRVTPPVSFTSQSSLACAAAVAVARTLRPSLHLEFLLVDDASGRTLSRSVAPAVSGETLAASIQPGSGVGSYRLRTVLARADGTVLAQVETPLTRVAGPF